MNVYNALPAAASGIEQTAWRIDPSRSSIEFEVPMATLREADSELEIEATTELDLRTLGMTFTLPRTIGHPATLTVRGRLVPAA